MRWHDSKHAASFTCRPWSSQHLAYLKRRHDSKAAASNAGVTHIFHKVLLYKKINKDDYNKLRQT